jgi:ribose transport system substrate-binding protein
VNAGLTGEVKVASWDAGLDQIEALKAGQIDFTLAQKPFEIGQLAVDWGYKYLTKKVAVPKKIRPGFFIFTQENMDTPEAQQYIYKP